MNYRYYSDNQDLERWRWEELAELRDMLLDEHVGLTEDVVQSWIGATRLERKERLFSPFVGFGSESDVFPFGSRSLRNLRGRQQLRDYTRAKSE